MDDDDSWDYITVMPLRKCMVDASCHLNWANIDFVVNTGRKYYTTNKAIRDGKYLGLPHSSAWQRSPIKIENFDLFS